MKLLRSLKQQLRACRRALADPLKPDGRNPLIIGQSCLEALSPFHLLLDENGAIVGSGASFRQVHGGNPDGAALDTVVIELEGDQSRRIACSELSSLQGRSLRLTPHANPDIEFAAQLIAIDGADRDPSKRRGKKRWLLDQRPIFETLEELDESGLSLQDLSLLDPIRISMVTMLMDQSLRQELLLSMRDNQE
jgi:hypothetical protein